MPRSCDIALHGNMVYTVSGESRDGIAWLKRNVGFEPWQGTPQTGIAIDGKRMAEDIADGALGAGLAVEVNGMRYVGMNCCEAN